PLVHEPPLPNPRSCDSVGQLHSIRIPPSQRGEVDMRPAAVIVTFVSLPFVLASPGSPAMAGAPGPRVAVPSHAAAAPAPPAANQFWTENSNGLQGGAAVSGDAFGHVMATGDFNADGYDDLVVHARRQVVVQGQTLKDAGGINVIYGGPHGLGVNAGPGNQY